jgi:hypothetical protein
MILSPKTGSSHLNFHLACCFAPNWKPEPKISILLDGFSIFVKDEKQEKNIRPYYGGQALHTILRIHGELIFGWDNIPGVDEFHLKQFLNEKLTLE